MNEVRIGKFQLWYKKFERVPHARFNARAFSTLLADAAKFIPTLLICDTSGGNGEMLKGHVDM